ncbi:MAG: acyl transferase [Candidatus Cyclobacteriaceae bacterium M3_2C_046]
MNFFKSFQNDIFSIGPANFEDKALELFHFQAKYNAIYRQYLHNLPVDIPKIQKLTQIPFLPIDFFKSYPVKTGEWPEAAIFESSGTTGSITSKHYIYDLTFYRQVSAHIFESFFGPLSRYHIFGLLPSYLERNNASLVFMVDHFINQSQSVHSGFYLHNLKELSLEIKQIKDQRTLLLLGVTFALIDMAENYPLPEFRGKVMETGGMKGKRREMVREEVHQILQNGFSLSQIQSEYGMTELMSQAYALDSGRFRTPSWMRVLMRDINDPFMIYTKPDSGGINIIDLANVHSCAFIETKDLGRLHPDQTFEVLGRYDNSDVRGCNLMVI